MGGTQGWGHLTHYNIMVATFSAQQLPSHLREWGAGVGYKLSCARSTLTPPYPSPEMGGERLRIVFSPFEYTFARVRGVGRVSCGQF